MNSTLVFPRLRYPLFKLTPGGGIGNRTVDGFVLDAPTFLAQTPTNNLGFESVILTVNAARQHHCVLGNFASVRFAACQQRRCADGFALLFPRIREKGIRPSFERFDASMFRVQKLGNRLVQSCFVSFARWKQ